MNKKCYALYVKAKKNPRGIKFSELKTLCGCIGLTCVRTKGSHFIFRLDVPFFLISIQKMKDNMAKPYQVKQLLNFIEENSLDIME